MRPWLWFFLCVCCSEETITWWIWWTPLEPVIKENQPQLIRGQKYSKQEARAIIKRLDTDREKPVAAPLKIFRLIFLPLSSSLSCRWHMALIPVYFLSMSFCTIYDRERERESKRKDIYGLFTCGFGTKFWLEYQSSRAWRLIRVDLERWGISAVRSSFPTSEAGGP